jgi:quinol monooxygenase YgiN
VEQRVKLPEAFGDGKISVNHPLVRFGSCLLYIVIWEFQVKPQHHAAFEQHYSGNGSWAKLFRNDPAYVETQLLRDPTVAGRYLSVDIWRDEASYQAFKEREHARYQEMDSGFEAFTERESLIGSFEVVE